MSMHMHNMPPAPPPPRTPPTYKTLAEDEDLKKLENRLDRLEKKLDNFIRTLVKQNKDNE